MEILKHTFEIERYGVQDGEVVDLDPELITCRFSLTIKAMELFEEEFGKPIITVLFGGDPSGIDSSDFIKALACSCYFVLENNTIKQNQATKEAFKNLEIYNTLSSDVAFTADLTGMVYKCIENRTQKSLKNNGKSVKTPKN